jgi:hypothetical protein
MLRDDKQPFIIVFRHSLLPVIFASSKIVKNEKEKYITCHPEARGIFGLTLTKRNE